MELEDDVSSGGPLAFVEALDIGADSISTRPQVNEDFNRTHKLEFERDRAWVQGTVSRVNADKICLKWIDGIMMEYIWIEREDIPTKLRFDIRFREQISELVFAAAVACDDTVQLVPQSRGLLFGEDEDFIVPLKDLIVYSSDPNTIYIYAKPRDQKRQFEFELIKSIKCNKESFTKFAVDHAFHIDRPFVIKSAVDCFNIGGKYAVLATSDIVISKTGTVEVSCSKSGRDSKSKCGVLNYGEYVGDNDLSGGCICLISGGNVVNEGNLLSKGLNANFRSGGAAYIDTDGVFENHGVIDCGEDGFVHIKCSEFKNDGVIIPIPKVTMQETKKKEKGVLHATAKDEAKSIILTVSDHKGHRSSRYHPRNLLVKGSDEYYHSADLSGSGNDWITFRTQNETPIYPLAIVIRNGEKERDRHDAIYFHESRGRSRGDDDQYGLKTVSIEGSADGIRFDDWIKIENICKSDAGLQTFTVSPVTGYFAWERAFIYFKLNILENHGSGRRNKFCEFRIMGRDEE